MCCPGCVDQWYLDQKERALAEMSRGGGIKELFRIVGATLTDPDDPSHRSTLYGHLIFTDKGVLFAACEKVTTPQMNFMIHGGLLGILIWELQYGKKNRQAQADARMTTSAMAGDLTQVMARCRRVIAIPKASITEITYSWFRGLRIKGFTGKESKSFALPNKRQTYEEFRSHLDGYR
jgi:hypothetical protein